MTPDAPREETRPSKRNGRIGMLAMMAGIAALAPSNADETITLRTFDRPMVTTLPADPYYKPRRRGGAPVARLFPRSQSEAKAHVTAKRKRKLAKASKRRNRR